MQASQQQASQQQAMSNGDVNFEVLSRVCDSLNARVARIQEIAKRQAEGTVLESDRLIVQYNLEQIATLSTTQYNISVLSDRRVD